MANKILDYVTEKVEGNGAQYKGYGIFGMLNAPFYYFFWLYIGKESYESLLLRAACFILCFFLVIHNKWPSKLKPFLPLYWYATLLFTLPFFFTYMLLMNHGSEIWVTNTIVIVFFTLLLVDFFDAVILLVVGSLLGTVFALAFIHDAQKTVFPHTFNYVGFFVTYFVAILIGSIFARNRQSIENLKRQTIKAQAESQEKTEFIANMSHDLRTPLSGLLSMSELEIRKFKKSSALTPERVKQLQVSLNAIHQSAQQLHHLFESILETTKIGYASLGEAEYFSITEVIDNVINLFYPALMDKHLDYTILPIRERPIGELKSYPLIIERILINLVSNAIKFTHQGKITLAYGLDEQADTKFLVLKVIDTGVGIDESDQEAIFKSFKRLTPSYKKNSYSGIGLGLHSTERMIEKVSGNISVYSGGKDKGSTFTCTIPVEKWDEENNCFKDGVTHTACFSATLSDIASTICDQPTTREEQHAIESSTDVNTCEQTTDTGTGILLVEDSALALLAAKSLLENHGAKQIDTAKNVAEAITYATKHQYQLILMDIGLPDGDGKDAAQKIRTIEDSKNQQTPIVALTGHVDEKTKKACLAVKMNDVCHKPLTFDKIQKIFLTFLE